MNFLKYGIYIGAIVIIALLFEQIMTVFYNLTMSGIKGQIEAYIYLCIIWLIIFLLARLAFNKKVHPKSSQFALWAGIFHIGITLAIYFFYTNPLLLLAYPIVIGVGYRVRQSRPHLTARQYKVTPIHPELVDDRGGLCILRIPTGFLALKFFTLALPLPFKELLLYLYSEQLEHTFEITNTPQGPLYQIGLIFRGRHYDKLHEFCLDRVNRLRQFLKKVQISFSEVTDCLNILRTFYTPYFYYEPSAVDASGLPLIFPHIANTGDELRIEKDLEDFTFTLHTLRPTFKESALYPFLTTMTDLYFFQFHNRPLSKLEITLLEEKYNEEYKRSLKRLTTGLEDNAEFQAASYLFSSVGQVAKENIEPLLDQTELAHLDAIKKSINDTKGGAVIGLWDVELRLIGNPVLAQTLAIKLGGAAQSLPPSALTPLALRTSLGVAQTIDSKSLFAVLPKQVREETNESVEAAIPVKN